MSRKIVIVSGRRFSHQPDSTRLCSGSVPSGRLYKIRPLSRLYQRAIIHRHASQELKTLWPPIDLANLANIPNLHILQPELAVTLRWFSDASGALLGCSDPETMDSGVGEEEVEPR